MRGSISQINYSSVVTRVGLVFVLSNEKGVTRIIFGEKGFRNHIDGLNGASVTEGGAAASEMARELGLYFDGKLSEFKTPIDISEGTPFQNSVWMKLLDIPYGGTATYREIAENIGRSGAARAVGNAVGANPIPIVIPCHRVLASNGLGGYSSGIDIKKVLLRVEGTLS
ncbi:MAG: methylated-DNA--[protein]-cysteine S-methyltransferase [Thermodesulfobacteriota bacterium]